MQCPKCNHPLSDDSVKCMYCGEPIHGGASVFDTSEELSIEEMVMHTLETVPDKREQKCEEADTDPLSLEKTAAMLGKMKGLLDDGRFDADVYERMALDSIKDYLSTLDDSSQLIFVSYEIGNSKLAPFLTEEMIERIRMVVMDAISER